MSAKSEREKRREERLAAERAAASSEHRRLLLGYVVAGVMTLAVVVGLFIVLTSGGDDNPQVGGEDIPDEAHIQVNSGYLHNVTPDGREGTPPPALQQGDLEVAAKKAGCELQLDNEDEGATHITDESEIPDYKTNPPTSGNHNPQPQADGAYSEAPDTWYVVHSMEHGRIEIQYSPDLPEEDQLAIKGVFDEDPNGMLLFPNADMPYEVADDRRGRTCSAARRSRAGDARRDPRLPRHLSAAAGRSSRSRCSRRLASVRAARGPIGVAARRANLWSVQRVPDSCVRRRRPSVPRLVAASWRAPGWSPRRCRCSPTCPGLRTSSSPSRPLIGSRERRRASAAHPGEGPVLYRSGVIDAPARFDLAGIGGELRPLEFRARTDGGEWSDWVETANGDPVYFGGADQLQVRSRGCAPRAGSTT